MVLAKVNSSAILLEELKDRIVEEMQRVYRMLVARLQKSVCAPRKHIMDNKCPSSSTRQSKLSMN